MKRNVIKTFLVMGPCVSGFMFFVHAIFSNYGMNPLSFILCSAPTIVASSLLVLNDEDY